MNRLPPVFLWLVLASPALAQEAEPFPLASPESVGVPASAVQALRDEVAGYVESGAIVGGELLVIKNRKTILHEALGDRDREEKKPMEKNTIFNIRSQTKALTGAALQILIDEGKVQLSDPAAKFLPAFDNDKSRAITVEQLLTHRSGLPLTVISFSLSQYPNLQAQVEAAGKKGPDFPPGEKFWYSDAGSDTVAAIVEQVAGMPVDQFITQRLLEPLGMRDSFYPTAADDPRKDRLASLYIGAPGKWNRFWEAGGDPMYPFAWGSQTLYSTPADYARFLACWMDGGKTANGQQILSADAMQRILTPVSHMSGLGSGDPYPTCFIGLKPYYGQLAQLFATGDSPTDAKVKVIGHSGSDGTIAYAFPEHDLIVCYFTQSRGQATVIRFESAINRELLKSDADAPLPAEWQPYLGVYYANFAHYKNTPFRVGYQNGSLTLDIPDQLVFELKPPDADGRFVFAFTPKVAVTFRKDESGKVIGMNLIQNRRTHELTTEPVADEFPETPDTGGDAPARSAAIPARSASK